VQAPGGAAEEPRAERVARLERALLSRWPPEAGGLGRGRCERERGRGEQRGELHARADRPAGAGS
jgi:hypothetical protein